MLLNARLEVFSSGNAAKNILKNGYRLTYTGID